MFFNALGADNNIMDTYNNSEDKKFL